MSLLALLGSNQAAGKTYIEDVFLVNLRTGTGATASVTGGPNLATYGGMVHFKPRNTNVNINNHTVVSSARNLYYLETNTTSGGPWANGIDASGVTFTSDGYTTPGNARLDESGKPYVEWVSRNAPNFFQELVVTKSAGSNRVIDLSPYFPSSSVGMVKVKRADASGSWYIWHRSLTAGKLLIGETTAAEATLGHITVSGKTLTLVNGVIADGTYHIEAYAHDTSADGLIQCSSFTPNGSSDTEISTGWEPQYLFTKRLNDVGSYRIFDSMRGLTVGGVDAVLNANTSGAESVAADFISPTATGFVAKQAAWEAEPFIYIAIRRGPMRLPTSGTQVFAMDDRNSVAPAFTASWPVDMAIVKNKTTVSAFYNYSRLTAPGQLQTTSAAAEGAGGSAAKFDYMLGFSGDAYAGEENAAYAWMFRRYPGVLDIVCTRGTGIAHDEPHGLTVAPELILWKKRSGSGDWGLYANFGVTTFFASLQWGATARDATATYTTSPNGNWGLGGKPTATHVPLDATGTTNTSGADYEGLLFATLAGVSKVGAIAGTGVTQAIDCGFAAGARFVLAMLTSGSGATSVYVWDSVRGIVAGNDPFLLLNSTAAENTSTDYIDPHASGFELPAGSPINAVGTTAVFFAIA